MIVATKLKCIFFTVLTSMVIFSCVNPPDYPDTPVIKYEGLNKTSVYQGNGLLPDDTLVMFFSFTDGDGDLSFEDSTDIFLFDSRLPTISTAFSIPSIPEDGTGNGIRGEISIKTINRNQNICCIDNGIACDPNPQIAVDTFSYSIQIRDRAGNFSNVIRTEVIDILCQ